MSGNGRTLGDFLLKDLLGRGGGGEVYRAEQLTLGREAVVKVMSCETGSDASERFLREARLASQLDHPFAAHVYGFGTESDGTLWIAMELVRGTALDTVIREQGPISLARFVPFFERLCEVLQAAHEQGIVHRDIKPANVMVLSRVGRLLPKLLDLGIARRQRLTEPDAPARLEAPHAAFSQTDSEGHVTLSDTTANRLANSETFDLTRVGVVVGTPFYMAPEQWSDASTVGSSADLYSLSLLAYEALSGRRAFEANSIRALAKAHSTSPLPALPAHVPAAVLDVLAKGAAKRPADRYVSATDLATALRAASGLGVEPYTLPQLEDSLRENFLSHAPQPIAESVAFLEGARTPKQQLEAVGTVRRVVIRHLGVMALAVRARMGPGGPADAGVVVAALKHLASSKPTNEEWLALARDLCRPFAFRKAVHPLPELVSFFFSGDSDAVAGNGFKALTSLGSMHLSTDETDDMVFAHLQRAVPAVGAVLHALALVFDYPLVVQKQEPERWMGTRRARRLHQTVISTPVPTEGTPYLVDADGFVTLSLWPLLQLFTPGAGLPDELFYLDGAGRHGARMVALPETFERHSSDVWPWVSQHILEVADFQAQSARAVQTPYKGLAAFTAADSDNYFGRENEAESFANRLRLAPLLAVVGPSGSGKSSFVLAGVLPLLPKGWRAVVTRPGATPLATLLARLAASGLRVDDASAEALGGVIGEGESLLLVVDQFEELVTLCSDIAAREQFAELLVRLAESPTGRFRVVLTLRDDFLIKIQGLRALRERLSSALQLLGTPANLELRRVVTEPARRVGYGFDDESLPDRMVAEVAEHPGALALLSFTMSQLWELRDRQLNQMRAKTYEALGGVGGALAHHAEMTLAQLKPDEALLVREAFRHLVTSQATRAVLSRAEMLEVLGNSLAAISVIEKLVIARLLVTSEDTDGDDRIEIIHEALIVSWPRLVGWLREDAETARLRDSLRASARQWADRGRPSGLLWRKETLAEYRLWRARFSGRLTQLEEGFASASLRDESRTVSIRRTLISVAIVSLVVGMLVVLRAYKRADASAVEAKQRLAELRVEQARLAALDDKPFETLVYAEEARKLDAKGAAVDYLEQRAQTKLGGQLAARALGEPAMLIVSADQQRVMALGRNATSRLLSLPSLGVIAELQGGGEFQSFVFLSDAKSGLLCREKSVSVVSERGEVAEAASTKSNVYTCALSPKGDQLAAVAAGRKLHLWSVSAQGGLSAERVVDLPWEEAELRYAPDGKRLALFQGPRVSGASAEEFFLTLVDTQTATVTARLPSGGQRVTAAVFSSDGAMLATGSRDDIGRVFTVNNGQLMAKLMGHSGGITDVAFSDDNQLLITSSSDSTARVWGLDGSVKSVLAHHAVVASVQFRDATNVVTTTTDGRIHAWALGTNAPILSFYGHASSLVGFAKVGRSELLSSASDGMVRLWNLDAPGPRHFPTPTDVSYAYPTGDSKSVVVGIDLGRLFKLDVSTGQVLDSMELDHCKDGYLFAIGRASGALLVSTHDGKIVCVSEWVSGHAQGRQFVGHQGAVKATRFNEDGSLLASVGTDGVLVWEVSSGTLVGRFVSKSLPRSVAFASKGSLLATGDTDGTVHLWNFRKGAEIMSWKAHNDAATWVDFTSSDGELLTSGADQRVALWSVETGVLRTEFAGQGLSSLRAYLQPGGKRIAGIDPSGVVQILDIASGRAVDVVQVGGYATDVAWNGHNGLVTALGTSPQISVFPMLNDQRSGNWHCQNPLELKDGVVVARRTWPRECQSP